MTDISRHVYVTGERVEKSFRCYFLLGQCKAQTYHIHFYFQLLWLRGL